MARLSWARMLVAVAPFKNWRHHLGLDGEVELSHLTQAKELAAHVDWAARLLPFNSKCLPRAAALSWMLRHKHIPHSFVFAARPLRSRRGSDDLHAWIEVGSVTVIGDLPGPWIETLRLGTPRPVK